ncbi:serine protease [uncultured Desulfosarcina sp.]|uniref:trypsin-like serine peptidase n=1 Tax=uncultured Desulfosarcina sp. TaxID=218289 RepID=UPI0029C67FCA|nr:serine protease [uncultured Desulfosarcina sp.]
MNGLKITILQGTTLDQKKEYFYDRKYQSIIIGCDPEACDISFPEHYRDAGVGNEHIAFKRSLGRYQVDLNTDNFVLINGEVPFEDQEITGVAKVQLGENVTIEIEVVDQRKQPHQKKGKNPQPGEQIKWAKRYLRLLFVIIIGLFAAAVYFSDILNRLESNIQVSDENIQRVTDRLQNLSSTLNKIETQTDGITRATIDTVSRSVYLVLVRNSIGGEQPTGTAWVVEGGRLATNAHVARIMETLKSDEEMIVRSPVAPYRSHAVKETLIHPGYAIFNDIWEDYLPCQKVGNKLGLFRTINPADVAILYVEDNEGLSSPLPLATMDELASIEPGMAIAFVGYPSESLLPGNNKKPVPVAQQDEIIRITDFFQTRQNELPNRLIHHGLPVTGGASGSPMFDAEGKVIGVISSMNVSPGNRYGARSPTLLM